MNEAWDFFPCTYKILRFVILVIPPTDICFVSRWQKAVIARAKRATAPTATRAVPPLSHLSALARGLSRPTANPENPPKVILTSTPSPRAGGGGTRRLLWAKNPPRTCPPENWYKSFHAFFFGCVFDFPRISVFDTVEIPVDQGRGGFGCPGGEGFHLYKHCIYFTSQPQIDFIIFFDSWNFVEMQKTRQNVRQRVLQFSKSSFFSRYFFTKFSQRFLHFVHDIITFR